MGKGSESVCHHQFYDFYRRGQRYIKRRPLSSTREQKLGLYIEMHGPMYYKNCGCRNSPTETLLWGLKQQPALKPVVSPLRALAYTVA